VAKRSAQRTGSRCDQERKLDEYNRKRDFSRTAEPAPGSAGDGDRPGPEGGRRFVVQRHRARRLHYDVRLEVDGVLASWAVPKGPTLDPKVRSLAVHVEDHPIEYFDFEGVIPSGEYGGGDVIVWDWGTWSPHRTDDPAAAIADGELHFDVRSEKLSGRFVLVRTDRDRSRREQWLLLHKNDDHAQPGWNPEDHPRSVKTGRTNDEVAAAPEARWHSDRPAAEAEERLGAARWPAPTDDELAALDDLPDRGGRWELQGRTLKVTNLDKVLFPGRGRERPVTKRELIRYYAAVAPTMLPYLDERPVNLHRYPGGVDKKGFWHKELPSHAPDWLDRWHNDDADPDETQWYAVLGSVPAVAWMANYGAVELHPWTSRRPEVRKPTWAFIDIDPGESTSFDDVLVLARLYRTALDHLGVDARPKVTGQRGVQIWVPIRPGPGFDDTRAWVESVSRAVGRTVPDLVSWEWHKRERGGLARLDYTQNAINRTLVAPYSVRAAPGAPVSVPLEWDELDDPDLRPDRWTVRTVGDRLAEVGDPFAPLVARDQTLPSL
jgi:bifunctional non-homologous end joining protein LigD